MSKEDFIEQIARAALKYAPQYGIAVVSPVIAQACLESAYGTSNKAQHHNYFGLKYRAGRVQCHSGTFLDGSQEQAGDGTYYPIEDSWYEFDSLDAGVEGYFQFINCSIYANLKGVTDPKRYLELIKQDGYATSLDYVNNVWRVVQQYGLTKYDASLGSIEGGSSNTMKIYISPSDQTGNRYSAGNTNEATVCRSIGNAAVTALKRNGYDVKIGANGSTYRQRVADSNNWGADVHVPIHTNAGGGDGTVVFAHPSSVNNKYVKAVYQELAKLSPGADDGIRSHTGLYEINQTKCVCVYVEAEFHDDASLAQWIIEHTTEIGEAIAKAFCEADGKAYKANGVVADKPNEKPDTPSGTLYRVQAGAYKNRNNAIAQYNKLVESGFDVYLIEAGGYYKCQVGAYSVKANADAQLNRVKAAGFDAFITTQSGTAVSTGNAVRKKSNAEIAKEIFYGTCSDSRWSTWGNGDVRKQRLAAAGYDFSAVQAEVNKLF